MNNTHSSFIEKFTIYVKACQPYLFCETFEEALIKKKLVDLVFAGDGGFFTRYRLFTWDEHRGLLRYMKQDGTVESLNCKNPTELIDWYSNLNSSGTGKNDQMNIIIVNGFHHYIKAPKIVRALLNSFQPSKQRSNMLLFVSPRFELPYDLEKHILNVDFPLPGDEELSERLEIVRQSFEKALPKDKLDNGKLVIPDDIKHLAIDAAKGLTHFQAEDAFTVALLRTKGVFNNEFVSEVFQEKINSIKKAGYLTYMEPDSSFDDLGGLGALKNWLKVRSLAFTKEAREYGIPYPRGVLLASPPGCGKSQTAKALSKEWNMPCFLLDVGSLFSGTVGSTEANFRAAIRIIDAIGKCILFIDEVEKGLNKDAVSGKGDTGTSSRSFASILTWMNDRTSPVFVIMTSNDFTVLPPELIRKGRLSELFWIDIPDTKEREEIWKVIIRRYKRDPEKFDIAELTNSSEDFTGSEIKDAFEAAMANAFFVSREVNQEDVISVLAETKPQAVVNASVLEDARKKAKDKLRDAKGVTTTTTAKELRLVQIS